MKRFIGSFFVTLAVLGIAAAAYYAVYRGAVRRDGGGGSAASASGMQQSASESRPEASAASSEPNEGFPAAWNDSGIFSAYYPQAYAKLSTMTPEEKAGQILLARCPAQNAAADIGAFHPGGFVLFEQDFKGKTAAQVEAAIRLYQDASAIPMLMAVDEEGGTIVRISSNAKLRSKPFASPQHVYAQGGFPAVRADTLNKAALLKKLGLNVNLAPVCDVSVNPSDYIYARAFGKPAAQTGEFVATVVHAMRESGLSSTLKHFPGYGNNPNTHTGIAVDNRPYSTFETSDWLPFEAGIGAGAESVLVAHTIVQSIDPNEPASFSPAVHRILRDTLHFTGVVMTDDLSMDAVRDYTHGADPSVQAVLAGNDLLIETNYAQGYASVLAAVRSGVIPAQTIDRAVFRILAWKYARGILR